MGHRFGSSRGIALATLVCGLLAAPAAARAATTALCAAAGPRVAADETLAEAVRAAFGAVSYTATEATCINPVRVLAYPSSLLLVTMDGAPGRDCPGCRAKLSAFVLAGRPGRPAERIKAFLGFAQVGTNGSPGRIAAATVGGLNGLTILSGGEAAGRGTNVLDLYALDAGHIVHLRADAPIVIDADNGGATGDPAKATTVTGRWAITPGAQPTLVVDYDILAKGRRRTEHVVWRLDGRRLVLVQGTVPAEIRDAAAAP